MGVLEIAIRITTAVIFGGSPTRIAAQVVSGIGFLGAGVILREGLRSSVTSSSRRAINRTNLISARVSCRGSPWTRSCCVP